MKHARNIALWTLLPLSAVFLFWPGIDLWFSRLFVRVDGRFSADTGLWHLWRMTIWNATIAVALFSLFMLALSILRRPVMRISPRIWLFFSLGFALGPGLVTNAILKTYWGRARPQSVLEFGGGQHFTPPVVISHECASNCSFVSGEGSGAAMFALLLGLVFLPALSRRWRWFLAGTLALIAGWSGLLRIMTGGHFLSDTLFAIDLMVIIGLSLYIWLGIARLAPVTPRGIWSDLLAAFGLLRPPPINRKTR